MNPTYTDICKKWSLNPDCKKVKECFKWVKEDPCITDDYGHKYLTRELGILCPGGKLYKLLRANSERKDADNKICGYDFAAFYEDDGSLWKGYVSVNARDFIFTKDEKE